MGIFGAAVEARAKWTTVASSSFGFGYSDDVGLDSGSTRDDRPEPKTLEDTVRLPVVWGCIRVRSQRISSMNVSVAEGELPRWAVNPDPPDNMPGEMARGQTMQDFIAQTVVSMDLAGNAFWGVARDSANMTIAAWCLDPQYITYYWDRRTGRYRFRYNGVSGLEIVLIPNLVLPNYPVGLSPIDYQRLLLRTSKGGQRQAEGYFQYSSIIPGVISSDGNMTQGQAKQMRRNWRRAHSGPDRGYVPAYIGSGKWQSIGMSAEQSQFLTSRQYTDSQIAQQIFGVDPTLLALPKTGSSLTYTTLQSRETALLVELQPVVDRIQAALTWLNDGALIKLTPRTWIDELTRWKIYEASARVSKMLGLPTITAAEIREREGMPPLTIEQIIVDGAMLVGGATVETDTDSKIMELEDAIAALQEGEAI